MRSYLLFIFFVFSQHISAQHLFQKTYGNSDDDWFWSMEVVNDSDIFIAGYTRENAPNNNTILLTRLDSSGNIEWSKSLYCLGGPSAYRMLHLSNGTMLTTGSNYYGPVGVYNVLLINTDYSGNILWDRNWKNNETNSIFTSIESSNQNIISAGYIRYYDQIDGGVKLIKTDLSGNLIWNRTYIVNYSAFGWDVAEKNNGNYVLSGSTSATSNSSDYDMLLMETDSTGNLLWAKAYGGFQEEYSANLVLTHDGGIIAATTSFSYDTSGFSDIIVIRTDSVGNVLWSKKFGGDKYEILRGMLRDTSGNYLLYGSCGSFYPAFPGTGFVFKIDDSGDLIWSRLYGTNTATYFFDAKQIHNQLIFCGQTRSPVSPTNLDGYLTRTDWFGNSGCNDTSVALNTEDIIINTYNLSNTDSSESFIDTLPVVELPLTVVTNILCDSIIGVNEIIVQDNILLYPNPNDGKFLIASAVSEKIKKIEITNVLGQIISFNEKSIDDKIYVDIDEAVDGLYFINLITENNKYSLKTIIQA